MRGELVDERELASVLASNSNLAHHLTATKISLSENFIAKKFSPRKYYIKLNKIGEVLRYGKKAVTCE